MTWNYRVTKRAGMLGDEYEIREVHYDGDDARGWTVHAMAPFGETLDELRRDLEYMAAALALPVLDLDEEEERRSEARKTPDPTTDTRAT